MGHLLMENRSGLVVDSALTTATGTAEREATASMLGARPAGGRITVGTNKLFDTRTPRTTRHAGCAASQRLRKRIEEGFGGIKAVAGLRKTRHRGTARVGWMFTLAAAAYNLVRIPKPLAPA